MFAGAPSVDQADWNRLVALVTRLLRRYDRTVERLAKDWERMNRNAIAVPRWIRQTDGANAPLDHDLIVERP